MSPALVPRPRLLPAQARPMLHVAVEAESVADLSRLERGLRRLHRADPAAEVCRRGRL